MIQYALIVVEKNELRIRHFPMLKRTDQVEDVLTLAQAERQAVESALAAANYRKSKTAKLLDISRPTLNKKIQDYKISLPQKH